LKKGNHQGKLGDRGKKNECAEYPRAKGKELINSGFGKKIWGKRNKVRKKRDHNCPRREPGRKGAREDGRKSGKPSGEGA